MGSRRSDILSERATSDFIWRGRSPSRVGSEDQARTSSNPRTRSQLECVALSPDERRSAAGTSNGKLWTWEFDSGKRLMRIDCCRNGSVDCVAFSQDSRYIGSGEFQKAKIWDAKTGKSIRCFQMPDEAEEMIKDVEFTPDGKHLISRGLVVRV